MKALEIAVKALEEIADGQASYGYMHPTFEAMCGAMRGAAKTALASIAAQQADEPSTPEEIMKESMKYGSYALKDGKLIPLDQVFKSAEESQDKSAQPCAYCGSRTSVCDETIAHPAKHGKGEV